MSVPFFWQAPRTHTKPYKKYGAYALITFLWPLSQLFAVITALRRGYYRFFPPVPPKLPVIVIGNFYIGGSGKTPLLLALATLLLQHGYTPGVVSRGYGRKNNKQNLIVSPHHSAADVGDEPLLLQQYGLRVAVARKRNQAIRLLIHTHPSVDVILSDDGLQHWAMARDLEIVVFDERGVGNGQLLPAGPLRESYTRKVDYRLWHLSKPPPSITSTTPSMPLPDYLSYNGMTAFIYGRLLEPYRLLDKTAYTWEEFRMRPHIHALAGIGNPARFFDALSAQGLVFTAIALRDHYQFSLDFLQHFHSQATLLITEKDAVKCKAILQKIKNPQNVADIADIVVVPYQLALSEKFQADFLMRLRSLCEHKSAIHIK